MEYLFFGLTFVVVHFVNASITNGIAKAYYQYPHGRLAQFLGDWFLE